MDVQSLLGPILMILVMGKQADTFMLIVKPNDT